MLLVTKPSDPLGHTEHLFFSCTRQLPDRVTAGINPLGCSGVLVCKHAERFVRYVVCSGVETGPGTCHATKQVSGIMPHTPHRLLQFLCKRSASLHKNLCIQTHIAENTGVTLCAIPSEWDTRRVNNLIWGYSRYVTPATPQQMEFHPDGKICSLRIIRLFAA